jgi:hypothetical protein
MAQDRDRLLALVNTVMNLWVLVQHFFNFNIMTIFRKSTYLHKTNAVAWMHFTNWGLMMIGLVETCSSA